MMDRVRQFAQQFASLFSKRQLDGDFNAELESHLAMAIDENMSAGMSPQEAKREAMIKIGGMENARETHRDARGLPFAESVMQDLRYTLRTLRREPGFALFSILIIALGIGGCATVFSVMNTLLIRPLPFPDSDRLVWIANSHETSGLSGVTVQVSHLLDLRQRNKSFTDIAAYMPFYGIGDSKLTGVDEPERLTAIPVSQTFFEVLGVKPAIGRTFTKDECKWNGPRAILLTNGLWKRRFGSDRGITGRALTIDDQRVTVAGVLPESFDFSSVFTPGTHVDFFTPFSLTPETERWGNTLSLVGRLKPGAILGQASAEASVIADQCFKENPNRNNFIPRMSILKEHVNGQIRPALLVLGGAIAVVMLIVCANLSNLLLARSAARQKEIAVRSAMGATRGRLTRQMLTESLVLSAAGAIGGLLIAIVAIRLISHLDSIRIPLLQQVQLDYKVLAFTVLVAAITGILFGLLPALHTREQSLGESLKDNARGSSGGRRHAWIRSALVISEIAFAGTLLVGTGLLVRSFIQVLNVDYGFKPANAATMRIDPSSSYNTQGKRNAYFDEALRRVKAIPGVTAAGITDALPFGRNRTWGAGAEGQNYGRGKYPLAFANIVSYGYFEAMGIRNTAGRDFTENDSPSSEPVVIINQKAAESLWPGQNALGRMMNVAGRRRVIGIVNNVRHLALEQDSGLEVYIPMRQLEDYSSAELVVRTSRPFTNLPSSLQEALKPIEPNLPSNHFQTLQELTDRSTSPRRFIVMLLAGFAAFAVILAALGIYSVISYSVNTRKQEIGIRIALGATTRHVQSQILWHTFALAIAGLAACVVASLALAQVISGLLFSVKPNDLMTFACTGAVLLLAALIAGYVPARRASRLDATIALRTA